MLLSCFFFYVHVCVRVSCHISLWNDRLRARSSLVLSFAALCLGMSCYCCFATHPSFSMVRCPYALSLLRLCAGVCPSSRLSHCVSTKGPISCRLLAQAAVNDVSSPSFFCCAFLFLLPF